MPDSSFEGAHEISQLKIMSLPTEIFWKKLTKPSASFMVSMLRSLRNNFFVKVEVRLKSTSQRDTETSQSMCFSV